MIYPEISPLGWSIKHNIELASSKCRKCDRYVDVDIPIISKDFVGFESTAHECGEGYKVILLKPRSSEVQFLISEEA